MTRDLGACFRPASVAVVGAGVPAFDDVEAMAECAGLLARHRTLAV